MTTQTEALKLALEALDSIEWHGGGSCWVLNPDLIEAAIIEIKEALMSFQDGAQPSVSSATSRKPWVSFDENDLIGMTRDAFATQYCVLPVSESRIKALAESIEAKLRELNEDKE